MKRTLLILLIIFTSLNVDVSQAKRARLVMKNEIVENADSLNKSDVKEEKTEQNVKKIQEDIKEKNKEIKKKRPSRHVPIISSKNTRVSSPYGMRVHPITGIRTMHHGVDIAAPSTTYIYAVADGEVIMARPNGKAGNEIRIKHTNGMETRYLHMSTRSVNKGDKVFAGQIIGRVGATGRVTGPHLHLELKVNGKTVNPNVLFKF